MNHPPLTGFGNSFSSEAIKGALPKGQNSPQHVPFGLYAEQLSGTAFTAPRAENHRTWLYRLRPSVSQSAYNPINAPISFFGDKAPGNPNRLRWSPLTMPAHPIDFIDSLTTYGSCGDRSSGSGISIHLYACNQKMGNKVFMNADAQMLIVPQEGGLIITTECGPFEIDPLHIALIPRGMKCRIDPKEYWARGYICENHGALFRLPELGPIGANGLANARDFEAPHAQFEDRDDPNALILLYGGSFYQAKLDHSPFDVVAWHGNYVPYRYDLRRFNTINTVSFDHPDPSLFTVLTSPTNTAGVANCDFVIFPPRYMVAEHTFRPPWFHRNIMSEFMGLITGHYDAKAEGFEPGGASLHNAFSHHGPDLLTYEKAISADLKPERLENTMAFMFETSHKIGVPHLALALENRQKNYDQVWGGFSKAKLP